MHDVPMCNTLTIRSACNPCGKHMCGESGAQQNHCYRNRWCNKHILVVVVASTHPLDAHVVLMVLPITPCSHLCSHLICCFFQLAPGSHCWCLAWVLMLLQSLSGISVYVYIYIYIYVCVCMYVCVCTSLYISVSISNLLHLLVTISFIFHPLHPFFRPPLLYPSFSLLLSVFSFASSLCSFLQCPMFICPLVHSPYFIVLLAWVWQCSAHLYVHTYIYIYIYVWLTCWWLSVMHMIIAFWAPSSTEVCLCEPSFIPHSTTCSQLKSLGCMQITASLSTCVLQMSAWCCML